MHLLVATSRDLEGCDAISARLTYTHSLPRNEAFCHRLEIRHVLAPTLVVTKSDQPVPPGEQSENVTEMAVNIIPPFDQIVGQREKFGK